MINWIEFIIEGYNDLSIEANVLALTYVSLLRDAKFIKYNRINIYIENQSEHLLEVVGEGSTVCRININYNVDLLKQKEPSDKRKIFYEILFYCMDFLAEKKEWDLHFLESLKSTVINHDYIIFCPYLKPIKNKQQKVTAQLVVYLDFKIGYFSLNIYDKDMQLVKSIDFYKVYPHPVVYSMFFSKISWVSKSVCRVEDKEGEMLFDINIDDKTVRTHFEPKVRSLEVLQHGILVLKNEVTEADRKKYLIQLMQY